MASLSSHLQNHAPEYKHQQPDALTEQQERIGHVMPQTAPKFGMSDGTGANE